MQLMIVPQKAPLTISPRWGFQSRLRRARLPCAAWPPIFWGLFLYFFSQKVDAGEVWTARGYVCENYGGEKHIYGT